MLFSAPFMFFRRPASLVFGVYAVLSLPAFAQTINYVDGQPADSNTYSSATLLTLSLDSGAAQQSGVLGGAGGIEKIGAGILTLSGVNNYSGATTITGGTLKILSSGSILPDATAVTIGAGASLDISGGFIERIGTLSGSGTLKGGGTLNIATATNTTFSGTLDGTSVNRNTPITPGTFGALTLTGPTIGNVGLFASSGTVIANSGATYTNASVDGVNGSVQIWNGTLTGNVSLFASGLPNSNGGLRIGNGGTTGILAANVSLGGGYLSFDRSNDIDFDNDISGGNTSNSIVQKLGAGKLTFTKSNSSYGGRITIYSGTIQFGNGGTTGMLPGDISGFGGNVVFNRSNDVTYTNYISGVSSVSKLGAGTLTLSSTSSNWGSLSINEGSVRLGAANAIPDNPVSIGASGTLNLNNFSETIGILSGSGNVSLGTGTLTVNSSASNTYSGNITGSTGALTKNGSGTLGLSGSNSYSGATTISAGTLRIDSASALSSTSALTVNGTLDLNGSSGATSALSGSGAVNLKGGALTVGAGNTSTVFTGTISDTAVGGSLTKTGSGTLTLSGNVTYSGPTNISAGTLQIGSGGTTGALPSTSITNSGALVFNLTSPLSVNGTIDGTGTVTQNGSGTVSLGGNNSYSGTTTVNAGRISVAGNSALGSSTLALNGGGLTTSAPVTLSNPVSVESSGGVIDAAGGNLTLGGNFTGIGSLTKHGSGNLTLSGNNTSYTGTTTISAGTVTASASSLTGNVVNNAALVFAQASNGSSSSILSGSGTLTKSGDGVLTLSGNNATFSGATTISQGTIALGQTSALGTGTVSVSSGATLDVGVGSFDLSRLLGAGQLKGNGALSYGAAANLSLANVITGATSLTKSGTSTLTLSGNSDYSGGTILSAGTLAVGSNSALGSGTLTLDGGTLQAIGAGRTISNDISLTGDSLISGSLPVIFDGDFTLSRNRDLSVTSSVPTKITGSIGQSGGARSLLKYGSGELELTGANTYTGGTTIAEGTLRINNSTGSAFGTGAVTIEMGATLAGAGSFTGALQNNGNLSPGNSPALVTLSNYAQSPTGVLQLELGGVTRGSEYDAVNVTGMLNLDGTLQVSFYNDFVAEAGQSFDLLNWGSVAGTFDAVSLPVLDSSLSWNTSELYNTGVVSVAAVPEPSSVLLIAAGAGMALRRRRKYSSSRYATDGRV